MCIPDAVLDAILCGCMKSDVSILGCLPSSRVFELRFLMRLNMECKKTEIDRGTCLVPRD